MEANNTTCMDNNTMCVANNTTSMDNNTMYYDDYAYFNRMLKITIPVVFGLIVLIGGVGNLLVIIVVCLNRQMRNTTNILIVSLAVADLFFLTVCAPFTAMSYVTSQWPFGELMCKIYSYVTYVSAYASVYTLVLMSFDRYLAVVHAIRSMTMRTEYNAYIVIAVMWLLILVLNYRLLINSTVIDYVYNSIQMTVCINNVTLTTYGGQVFFMTFFLLGYAVPLILVCAMYGFLLKRLLYGVVPGITQSAENIRSKKRVAKLVIIVVAAFAVCWLPIHIIFIIHYFLGLHHSKSYIAAKIICNCLAYTNSCVNPILYAFLSENFRKSFKKLLCCGRPTTMVRHDGHERSNMTAAKAMELTALNNVNHTTTSTVLQGSSEMKTLINNLQ